MKVSASCEIRVEPVALSQSILPPVNPRIVQNINTSVNCEIKKAVMLPTIIQSDWPNTAENWALLTGEKFTASTCIAAMSSKKAYAMRQAVKMESFRTPLLPKYSLIRSVLRNTTGQGIIPTLIVKGPSPKNENWMSFPPMSSATTAFVMKNPARMIKTNSRFDLIPVIPEMKIKLNVLKSGRSHFVAKSHFTCEIFNSKFDRIRFPIKRLNTYFPLHMYASTKWVGKYLLTHWLKVTETKHLCTCLLAGRSSNL